MTNALNDPDKAKKCFVTGGTGLLGSYLLRYLVQNGYTNIRALRRKNSPMDLVEDVKDRIEWVEGDILDVMLLEEAMTGADCVYHSAAMVSFDPRDRDALMKINVEGTANIVNMAMATNIKKLVHVSSIAAVGRSAKQRIIKETNKWERSNLNSNYAISKYLAEQEVWRGIAEGLTAAIVNPTIILGSGFWEQGSTALFKQVWDGLRFYPTGSAGLVDVRNVVKFMIKLMESSISSERFILNDENMTYKDFFTHIASGLGKKPPDIEASAFLRGVAWRAEWLRSKLNGKRPLITKETATSSAETFYFDSTKSRQIMFNTNLYPIQQTMQEICEQLKIAARHRWKPMFLPV